MKRLILFIPLIILGFQSNDFTLLNGVPFSSARYMTTDNIGNIYVITENQLLKFNPRGKPLQNFSDSRSGELRSADASNPMKVLLFYPDMARIITLGTQFAPQSIIELRNLGISQPTLACNSLNEGFWVYDLQDFQLKKLNLDLQLTFQSGNLLQVVGKKIFPNSLAEFDQKVYLNDPEIGIMVFDQFAGFIKTIPIKGIKSFQVIRDELLYSDGESIRSYDMKRISEHEIMSPGNNGIIKTFRLNEAQLYLLTTDSLNIYSH
jgi:hypothetical protein